MDKLKLYAVVMGIGAVIGITVAEIWRRKMRHDSYLNYLPPPRDRDGAPTDSDRSGGRMREVANRVWSPVAASAKSDWARLRRIRAGAPRPSIGAPAPPRSSQMLPCLLFRRPKNSGPRWATSVAPARAKGHSG
jgi:hypothetical protein